MFQPDVGTSGESPPQGSSESNKTTQNTSLQILGDVKFVNPRVCSQVCNQEAATKQLFVQKAFFSGMHVLTESPTLQQVIVVGSRY